MKKRITTHRCAMTVAALLVCGSVMAAQKTTEASMALIPAGPFFMGSDETDKTQKGIEFGNDKPWYLDEHPRHSVKLPDFYLDRYEVTNGQFRQYVAATGAAPPSHWIENGYILSLRKDQLEQLPVDKLRHLASKIFHLDMDTRKMDKAQLVKAIDDHLDNEDILPANYVTWNDAQQFCSWAHKRLPKEAEWEKAAHGGDKDFTFPWGNQWRPGMSNTGSELWDEGVAPVGSYKTDKSVYGVYDLAGNVSEWTADWYQAYPHSDFSSPNFGEKFKVVRGAGWGGNGHYALKLFQRASYRGDLPPDGNYADVGFRCAADSPQDSHTIAHHQ